MLRNITILLFLAVVFYSCGKTAPFDEPVADQFDTLYCNDPIAINYNLAFPGTPDNSICIYPTDVFGGSYSFKDSIYNGEFELDTVLDYTIVFNRTSQTQLNVLGFCPGGDTIEMTATRYYKAVADSTMILPDSTLLPGQVFCRSLDTLSGSISKVDSDSTKIRINFTIASDTGVNYHIGTGTQL